MTTECAGRRAGRAGPALLAAASTALAAACLEPLDDDRLGYSPRVGPPDLEADPSDADSGLRRRIDDADQVPADVVPRRVGYARGDAVGFWELGAWIGVAVPLWWLRRCDEGGAPRPGPAGDVRHPPIVDSVPGSFDYTPFRVVQIACVTEAYAGERLASLRALTDARRLGLVEAPASTGRVVTAAVVAPAVALATDASDAVRPPGAAFYRGEAVALHVFGDLDGGATFPPPGYFVPPGVVYEPVGADGAALPPVFDVPPEGPDAAAVSGLWRVVSVELAAGVPAEEVRSASALFEPSGDGPVPTWRVAAWEARPGTVVRALERGAAAP